MFAFVHTKPKTSEAKTIIIPKKPNTWLWLVLAAVLLVSITAGILERIHEQKESIRKEYNEYDILLSRLENGEELDANELERLEFLSDKLYGTPTKHPNDDNYIGHQCVYEIRVGGKLYKYGKAVMHRINQRSGLPERIDLQVRDLQKLFPKIVVVGRIIYKSLSISTKDIKAIETEYIQKYVDEQPKQLPNEQRLPKGNSSHLNSINF